jgi:hypothetical protein
LQVLQPIPPLGHLDIVLSRLAQILQLLRVLRNKIPLRPHSSLACVLRTVALEVLSQAVIHPKPFLVTGACYLERFGGKSQTKYGTLFATVEAWRIKCPLGNFLTIKANTP